MTSRLIATSLKSRGLQVYESRPGQLRAFAREAASDVVDISICIATDVVLASASTWISVVLTILSTVFYFYYRDGLLARDGSIVVPIALLIYLPTLALAHLANQRRLEAARLLSEVQAQVLGCYVLHSGLTGCGAPQLLAEIDDSINNTMVQLQGYLGHPRPLASRHFSLDSLRGGRLPLNSQLYALGRDIGQRLRQLHSCLRRLSGAAGALLQATAGDPTHQPQALALAQQLSLLTGSIGRLALLKDLRSPLLLRAVLRPGCVLLAPLLGGCWLAGLAGGAAGGPAGIVFALVAGIILQVLLMTFHTLGLLLEDPFDCSPAAPPDTLSLLEFNHTLAYLTAPPGAADDEADDTPAAAAAVACGEVQVCLQPPQQQQQRVHKQQHPPGATAGAAAGGFSGGGGADAAAAGLDGAAGAPAAGWSPQATAAAAAAAAAADDGEGATYKYEY